MMGLAPATRSVASVQKSASAATIPTVPAWPSCNPMDSIAPT